MDFAAAHRTRTLGIPWVVLGEFWHGATRAGHRDDEVRRFLELGIALLDPEPVIPVYARTCAELQKHDKRIYGSIGQNDLWIAAVAIQEQRPLVTRNKRHFGEIAELEVVAID